MKPPSMLTRKEQLELREKEREKFSLHPQWLLRTAVPVAAREPRVNILKDDDTTEETCSKTNTLPKIPKL